MNLESSSFIKMANKKGHGGVRPGAGRKTKAEILGLAELIDEAWPVEDQKNVLSILAQDAAADDFATRHQARQLLLSYKFGKPTERKEISGPDGKPIQTENRTVEIELFDE